VSLAALTCFVKTEESLKEENEIKDKTFDTDSVAIA
jgi:hypothetical protein